MEKSGDLFNNLNFTKISHMSSEYIVEPSKIESQLNQIWDELQGIGKTRASLFNLIIYSESDKREDYLYKVARKVIEKFPCRVIMATIDYKAIKPVLKTSVSAITSESKSNAVACDFINISLSLCNRERTPFLIIPHLTTDLPTYLLWADDPCKQNPIASKLEALATRVIFDSELSDELNKFCHAAINHKERSGSDIADLNWGRIEGWRQLFSQTFKTKDKLDLLKKVSSIEICYNAFENEYLRHTKIQSLYLQAWLASRLEWTFKSYATEKAAVKITYMSDSKEINIHLKETATSEMIPGRITSVKLETPNGDFFSFERSKTSSQLVVLHYSTKDYCEIPSEFVIDKYESGLSLVKEIFHKGTSLHFLNVLKQLATHQEIL